MSQCRSIHGRIPLLRTRPRNREQDAAPWKPQRILCLGDTRCQLPPGDAQPWGDRRERGHHLHLPARPLEGFAQTRRVEPCDVLVAVEMRNESERIERPLYRRPYAAIVRRRHCDGSARPGEVMRAAEQRVDLVDVQMLDDLEAIASVY